MNRSATDVLRTGLRRVRLATASLGIAALVGTGALTWAMAAEDTTATTAESTQPSTAATGTDDPTATDTTTSGGTRLESDDSDDTADASSGAS